MKYIRIMFMQYLMGTNLMNWFKLLKQNRFRIRWWCIPKALVITVCALWNTIFMLLENLRYYRRIENTRITKDPVFIIGHWRSGTTFLVNLLSQDRQFGFFTILQTYAPQVFLTFNPILKRLAKYLVPEKRPMDNIKMNSIQPQEEEFAVANVLPYSIMHMTLFPTNAEKYVQYGLFQDLSEPWVDVWRKTYIHLLKKVTFMTGGKRLLLKSPNNTMRIKALLDMFPNAKFIHIYRNPYKVCASTMKMYRRIFSLFTLQGMVGRNFAEDFQINLYSRFYRKFFSEESLIPKENIVNLKYEDFVKDPMSHMERIYTGLGLDGYEEAKTALVKYVNSQKDYKTNKHVMGKNLVRKVREKCPDIFMKLGYRM